MKYIRVASRTDFSGLRLGRSFVKSDTGGGLWECLCDCGKIFFRTHVKLLRSVRLGKESSCGNCFDAESVVVSQSYRGYKAGATKRGLAFEKTLEEWKALIFDPCEYCGSTEDKTSHGLRFRGVDRKDNDIGYVGTNPVACCATCNFAKRAMPYEDWMSWIRRIKAA